VSSELHLFTTCFSGLSDYVVGGHTPNASRPIEQETSAPGGLVGFFINFVRYRDSEAGVAAPRCGRGLLRGLMEKLVEQVGGSEHWGVAPPERGESGPRLQGGEAPP
jgi:hypothetical protein